MTVDEIYDDVRKRFIEILLEKTGWGRGEVLVAFDKAFLSFALDIVNNPRGPQ